MSLCDAELSLHSNFLSRNRSYKKSIEIIVYLANEFLLAFNCILFDGKVVSFCLRLLEKKNSFKKITTELIKQLFV